MTKKAKKKDSVRAMCHSAGSKPVSKKVATKATLFSLHFSIIYMQAKVRDSEGDRIMIISKKGHIEIEGSAIEILAETACITRTVYEYLAENEDEGFATEQILMVMDLVLNYDPHNMLAS